MPGPPGGVWEGHEQHIRVRLMFAAPLSHILYLTWNSCFHTVFNLTIRSAKYWLPECSDTGRKKIQNCHAMTCECHQRVVLGNSLTVWYSQCLSTKNVYHDMTYPFEGPNGHLRQGQKMKWGEQWSRPWKWSWCARYISSKRSFRSRQSLTKDCKHVGSTFALSATATDESVQCSRLSPNCLLKMVTGHFVCWLLGCLHHVYLHIRTSSPSNFRALWSWDTPQTQQAPLYTRCAEETFILCGSLRKWHPVRTRIKCLRGHLV